MNSIAPASCARMPNEHYKNEEELLYACADAMHEEYKAIIDAGLTVQLDDPAIGENWDQQKIEPSVEGYRRYTKMQIDALKAKAEGKQPGGPGAGVGAGAGAGQGTGAGPTAAASGAATPDGTLDALKKLQQQMDEVNARLAKIESQLNAPKKK